jgi:oligogalacturonide lyase
MNLVTGKSTLVYRETGNFSIGSVPSIAANRLYVAFCSNEETPHAQGANYAGFKERLYAVKDGRITLAYTDGSGSFDVLKDTHQVGHFQFSPVDSALGMFCHEGPWNLVTQRIWLLDFISREVRPCFRQDEHDTIGHEFWTQDDYVFFDNRGPGHDGTITSDRTQAVVKAVAVNENAMTPFVGLMDLDGNLVRKLDMPYYCNHYHANPDNSVLVGDDVDDLVLIDISGKRRPIKYCVNITHHGTRRAATATRLGIGMEGGFFTLPIRAGAALFNRTLGEQYGNTLSIAPGQSETLFNGAATR